jgi:threonine dehydratase
VGLEILSALPNLATMVVPVGGGGLVGGIAAFLRAEAPRVRIVGVQSDQTNAMARSMAAGRRVDVAVPPTLADGLAGQIDDEGYAIGQFALDDIITVSEDDIASTMAWLARTHGIRAEGSGVVGVAAVRGARIHDLRGPVAVVVSGGNIDPARWQGIVDGER